MPTRTRSLALAVALAAAFAWPKAPVLADEPSRFEPLWIDAIAPGGAVGRTIPALLNVPSAWMIGDAAVVVLSDGPWPGQARERTVAVLLGEGAAVLELDGTAALGSSPENGKGPAQATGEELLPDVRGAAVTLLRDAGAGLIVALGHGAGGDAAVLAADLERAARPDAAEATIAVAASLGPGPARFALGGAPTGRGWPVRARLLCGMLAAEALPFEPGAETRCREALIGRGDAFAVRTAMP